MHSSRPPVNVHGPERRVASGRAVNISTGLRDRAGLHVGDTITLDTPTGRLELPIAGVVPDYVSDRGTVIVSRDLLVDRWGVTTVHRILLTLDDGAELSAVRSRIEERIGERYRLKILSLREVLDYHDKMINRAFAFTYAIQSLIIIVTIAGVFDLLVSAIVNRRREFALWRLVGAEERTLRSSVVLESVTVGLLGSGLGIAVGLLTAWIWIDLNFKFLLGYHLERHFAVWATCWYVAVVLATTMAAGLAAARQAERRVIIEDIQVE